MPDKDAERETPEFEVIDRRRAKRAAAQEAESEPTGEETPPAEAADEQEGSPALPPEVLDALVPPSVDSVLHAAVAHLARLAWENLGLVQGARTGEIRVDHAEAGLAVDAVDAIAKLLVPRMTGPPRRDLESLVADLKINYVKHTQNRQTE